MAQINLVNLKKKYDNGVVAIESFNLEIKDGEFMVLVGPSGSGKSTILRIIAGLEQISQGEIYMDNILVNNLKAKDREIAMVFQNYILYPHMSVYENIAFPLKIEKISSDIINDKIKNIAQKLEISDLLKRKPDELSGGQKQRVAIGKALVKNAKVILFDEPLSNLDAGLRTNMRMVINNLHKELKKTIVYVTHDQVEAMTMGDRICILKKGKIMQVDTPMNLYNNPKNSFVGEFLGTPSMNFINGRLINRGDKIYFNRNNLSLEIPLKFYSLLEKHLEKEIVVGIRGEDIHLSLDKDKSHFQGIVEIVEMLGNEGILYFKIVDNILLKTKIYDLDNKNLKLGEIKYFTLNMENVHFFSKTTALEYKSEEN